MTTSTPSITAIETVHNGTRFRSRTEARWAIFFESLGFPYDYEPDAFATRAGNYLPDFWLPGLGMYWEVKGVKDEGYAKAAALSHESMMPVVLAVGSPRRPTMTNQGPEAQCTIWLSKHLTNWVNDYGEDVFTEYFDAMPAQCETCQALGVCPLWYDGKTVHADGWMETSGCRCPDAPLNALTSTLARAYDAASMYRFYR